jgi:hypothetical protein
LYKERLTLKESNAEVLAVLAELGAGNFITMSQRSTIDTSSTGGYTNLSGDYGVEILFDIHLD